MHTTIKLLYMGFCVSVYCCSHLLVLSEQSVGLLKYVFSLSLCVTCNSTLSLPGPGDAKHPHIQ